MSARSWLLLLVHDLGVGPVVAGIDLDMPYAFIVLLLDGFGGAGQLLLGRGPLRSGNRGFVAGKGSGKNAARPVCPAAVMLHDLIDNLGHCNSPPFGCVRTIAHNRGCHRRVPILERLDGAIYPHDIQSDATPFFPFGRRSNKEPS